LELEKNKDDLDDLTGLDGDMDASGNNDELVDTKGDDVDPSLIDQSHVPTKDPVEEKKDDTTEKVAISHELVTEIWPYVIHDESIPSKGRVNGEGYEIVLELR